MKGHRLTLVAGVQNCWWSNDRPAASHLSQIANLAVSSWRGNLRVGYGGASPESEGRIVKRLLIILFVAVVLAGCAEWDKMFEPVQSVMSSPVQPTPRPTPVWAEWFLSQ